MGDAEKEKAEMVAFIQRPGFQLDFRHKLYTVYKLKEYPAEDQEKRNYILAKFAHEQNFLFDYPLVYDYYRFVKKKMLKKEWYWNQVRELGYLILLDLLHPDKATPTEAAKAPKPSPSDSNSSDEWVFIQNFQRTRRNYPELFFTSQKDGRSFRRQKRRLDKRFTRYSTVFSEMPLVDESDIAAVTELMMVQQLAILSHREKIENIQEFAACLRMVDPDDLICLEKFWEIEKRSLEIITSKYGQPSHNKWLISHIKRGTRFIEAIYQLIDLAVALRWFQTIKSQRKREKLFREKHPLRYSKEDAKRAVELNLKWFGDSVQVFELISRGASAYTHMGKFNVALYLYDECLKQISLEKEDLGLCYHNIAWVHRQRGKKRRYLGYLQKALKVFESIQSSFDEGITWAYIAEAYFLLGNKQKFEDAVQKSKNSISSGNLIDLKLAEAYLCVADCAMRIMDRAWEKEAVISGFRAASKLEDTYFSDYLWQRLTDLEAGRITFIEEQKPGKLKRPPVFRWHKDPLGYSAISPKSQVVKKDDEEDVNSSSH